MRNDSNQTLAVVFAAAALALSPLTAAADPGGKKEAEHGKSEAAHAQGHDPGGAKGPPPHANGKPSPNAAAALAPKKDAPPALPQAPVVNKAVTDLAGSCPKPSELRAQIEALAEKRKTSEGAVRAAQNESRKQLHSAALAQRKLTIAVKKPGGDSAALLASARDAQSAAVAQTGMVEAETQALYATEGELAKLATAAAEAAAACVAAEELLRTAAFDARKAVQAARKESAKARALARMRQPKALEAQRAAHAKQLEAMKKRNDEAKGAIDALGAVAAAAPAPATPAASAAKAP